MSKNVTIPSGIFPYVTEGAFDGKFNVTKPHCPPKSGLTWGFGIDFGAKHYYGEDDQIQTFFKGAGLPAQAEILKKYKIAGIVADAAKLKGRDLTNARNSQATEILNSRGVKTKRFYLADLKRFGVIPNTVQDAKTTTNAILRDIQTAEAAGQKIFLTSQQALDVTNEEWKRRMKSTETKMKAAFSGVTIYPPIKAPLTKALYGSNSSLNRIIDRMKSKMSATAQITDETERNIAQCNIAIDAMHDSDKDEGGKIFMMNAKRGNIVFIEKIRDILLTGGTVTMKEGDDDKMTLEDMLNKDSFINEVFVDMKAAYAQAKKHSKSKPAYKETKFRQEAFIKEIKQLIGESGTNWTSADDEKLKDYMQTTYQQLQAEGKSLPPPPTIRVNSHIDEEARQWLLRAGTLKLDKVEQAIATTIANNNSLDNGIEMLARLETIVEEATPLSNNHYSIFIKTMNKGNAQISGSVGQGGDNKPRDVIKIRALLASTGHYDYSAISQLYQEGKEEELIAALIADDLNEAVHAFQATYSRGKRTDGRVDAGGTALRKLNSKAEPMDLELPNITEPNTASATPAPTGANSIPDVEQPTPAQAQPTTQAPVLEATISDDLLLKLNELRNEVQNFFCLLQEEQICHESEEDFRTLAAALENVVSF